MIIKFSGKLFQSTDVILNCKVSYINKYLCQACLITTSEGIVENEMAQGFCHREASKVTGSRSDRASIGPERARSFGVPSDYYWRHQGVCDQSSESCWLRDGASELVLVLARPKDVRSVSVLETWNAGSTAWGLCSSSSSWAALVVEQSTRSCLGNAIASKDCTSSAMLLVWWRISRTQGFLRPVSPLNSVADLCFSTPWHHRHPPIIQYCLTQNPNCMFHPASVG